MEWELAVKQGVAGPNLPGVGITEFGEVRSTEKKSLLSPLYPIDYARIHHHRTHRRRH